MSLELDDLSELRTEFLARGFSFLSTTRANRYLSLGYFELCDEYDWPFLEASNSAVMPQTLSDLGKVESVVNSTSELKLFPLDRRLVVDMDPRLNDTGTAGYYYITASTTINVYPANTSDTFLVRYWKTPADLTSDTSTPLVPARWRYLIIEAAVRRAYQDSDNYELAGAARNEYQNGLTKMVETYGVQQHDRPDEIEVVASTDYGSYFYG